MNFLQKIGHALAAFFGSTHAERIEQELAVSAAPVVEAALAAVAHANPAVQIIVQVAEPVVNAELAKIETPKASS